MKEETFGPVLPTMIVRDEEEAIKLANDSDLGLATSIWTSNFNKGEEMARQIRTGNVWINNRVESPLIPWGGVKKSDVRKISSRYGLLKLHLKERRNY